MKPIIVIPARLASTRLPQKLLLKETGKSVLQHTYEAAAGSQLAAEVIVAADSTEIAAEVESFGGQVVMTRVDHVCGTDRVAEVVAHRDDVDLVINVQGDEPELCPDSIDLAIRLLQENPSSVMSTLATPIRERSQLESPHCVKIVLDNEGRAIYFSRSPIPHPREWDDDLLQAEPPPFLQHIGLYGYRRDFLLKIPSLPRTLLEQIESLEQLRVLANGYVIQAGLTDHAAPGIDTLEDYRSFVSRCSS